VPNLKQLNDNIAVARAKRKAPAKKAKPVPMLDDTPKRIAGALLPAMAEMFKPVVELLQKIAAQKPAVIDEKKIGKAVADSIKIPQQKITFPARKPVSYQATIQRRGKEMTGARIDPIE
jgi:hypothetical protein